MLIPSLHHRAKERRKGRGGKKEGEGSVCVCAVGEPGSCESAVADRLQPFFLPARDGSHSLLRKGGREKEKKEKKEKGDGLSADKKTDGEKRRSDFSSLASRLA